MGMILGSNNQNVGATLVQQISGQNVQAIPTKTTFEKQQEKAFMRKLQPRAQKPYSNLQSSHSNNKIYNFDENQGKFFF